MTTFLVVVGVLVWLGLFAVVLFGGALPRLASSFARANALWHHTQRVGREATDQPPSPNDHTTEETQR